MQSLFFKNNSKLRFNCLQPYLCETPTTYNNAFPQRRGLASSTDAELRAGLKSAAHIPQPNRGRGRFGQAKDRSYLRLDLHLKAGGRRECGNDKQTSLAALARLIIVARAAPADRLARAERSRHRLSAGLQNPIAKNCKQF